MSNLFLDPTDTFFFKKRVHNFYFLDDVAYFSAPLLIIAQLNKSATLDAMIHGCTVVHTYLR